MTESEATVRMKSPRNWLSFLVLSAVPWSTLLLSPGYALAAHLQPATTQALDEYVEEATARMAERLEPGNNFLWVDESPERLAKVRAGEIVVSPVGPNPKKVPFGLIHDWIGAAFISGVSLHDVLQVVRDYNRYKDWYHPNVADSKVLALGDEKDRFSMLLINKAILLSTAFDADYEADFIPVDAKRVYNISRAVRIQQIEDYDSPTQHVLPEGTGSGIMWRLMGITRFMERDGGVYVEFEGIALSRDIPFSVRWFVDPMVRRVSRSSLITSLQQTEKAVCRCVDLAQHARGDGKPIAAASGADSTGSASHSSQPWNPARESAQVSH